MLGRIRPGLIGDASGGVGDTGALLGGVSEPVLQRAFQYWKNVDPTIGERIEKGVRADQA